MNTPKLKLSLKKETLRTLVDQDLDMLDSVVGGTCNTTQCCNSNSNYTKQFEEVSSEG